MAKESGLGWEKCEVDDTGGTARDLKNDVTNIDFATPRAVQDVTGLDKSAMERLLLLADFSCNINGVFNDASNLSHDVGKTVCSTSTSRTITLKISGQQIQTECLLTDYSLTRAATGELTYTMPAVLQSGTAPTWTTP